MAGKFSITEPVSERATTALRKFLFGGVLAYVRTTLIAGLVGVWCLVRFEAESAAGEAAITVAGGLVGFVILAGFLYVIFLLCAPVNQRNEARTRLSALKAWRVSYKVVFADAGHLPNDEGVLMLVLRIRNEGRPGSFAAVLTDLEGAKDGLIDRFEYVHWTGRTDAVSEEIPRHEERTLRLGVLRTDTGVPVFEPVWPNQKPTGKQYALEQGSIVRVRISLRGAPEASYSETMAVQIRWDPDDVGQIFVSEVPEDDEATQLQYASTSELWDF